jgi:hypothetical protein
MKQVVGFDRRLELDWLDATVGLCQEGLDPSLVAERLQQRLEREIVGPEARRKTITVLLRIWVNVSVDGSHLRDEALQMITGVAPEERLWLHWGMSLLAYPFFRDVAATVGQLSRLQGTFSHAQVQRRMIENWGQRTTLQRAVRRLLRTFVDWGVVLDTDVRGHYGVASPWRTENRALALWFLDCALRAHEAEQVPLRELGQLGYTFPFDLLPFVGDVRRSERFDLSRQGLDLEMVAPAPE